jgi:hypothetical protein
MISIQEIRNSNEIKENLDNYDLTKIDSYFLFKDLKDQSEMMGEIYDFFYSVDYRPSSKSKDLDLLITELINKTDTISVKCLLYEKMDDKNTYFQEYLDLIPSSINELLDCIENAKDFRPVNRIAVLLEVLIDNIKLIDFNSVKNSIMSKIKDLNSDSNKYYSSVLIKVMNEAQKLDKTSKKDFQYCESLLDKIKNKKPTDIYEFEVYEKLFDFMYKNYKPKKNFALLLSEYIYGNLSLMNDFQKQEKLAKACKYVDNLSNDKELINKYKLEYRNVSKDVLNSMNFHQIRMGKEQEKLILEEQNKLNLFFESKTSLEGLFSIFLDIKIISSKEIDVQVKNFKKHSFTFNLIPTFPIDPKTGMVIKSDDPTKLVLENMSFNLLLQFSVLPLLLSFIEKFSADKDVEQFVMEMLKDNPICRPTKLNTVRNSIIGFLSRDFAIHLNNLVAGFEDGLKYFFEMNDISTIKYDRGYESKIDMNDIFRVEDCNMYKNKLSEFMTEDFIFLLNYLGVNSSGYNIRNKLMHGEFDDNDYSTGSAIYFAFLIIQSYFGFYCNKQNN